MMKLNKFFYLMMGAAALTITSCDDIDEQEPATGDLTLEQVQKTNTDLPVRTEASFAALFTHIYSPYTGASTSRADNFGYIMAAISLDAEGADLFLQDNNYNWFSVAGELSSRNANYANPLIRSTRLLRLVLSVLTLTWLWLLTSSLVILQLPISLAYHC